MIALKAASATLLSMTLLACTAAVDHDGNVNVDKAESALGTSNSGIAVEASYTFGYVGTPTYGYEPLGTFLNVTVEIDDAQIRKEHPLFDGFEQPFVFVQIRGDGANNDRLTALNARLVYKNSVRVGYFGERLVDRYVLENLRLDTLEVSKGIAVGLDTNVGTLWAQALNQDFPIVRR